MTTLEAGEELKQEKLKRLERAQKFGVISKEIVDDKKKERAMRFGMVTMDINDDKKKERALKFGL